jgi:putative ABC transport system permease protein
MSLLQRFLNLARSGQLRRDIDREVSFHIQERAEELVAQGMPQGEALAIARRQFGNRTYQGERMRDADIVTWLDSLAGDLRYALRALRRSPVFATVAVASLALGIGANTAIFTLLDAVVLRSLPVPQPEEIVQLTQSDVEGNGQYFTNPIWEEIRNRKNESGTTMLAAFSEASFNTADGGEARRVRGQWVSGEFFALFGMQPAAGRLLTPRDDVRGCPATAVLGHTFWQSEYGGRDVVGTTIPLGGHPFEIVGVTAPGFGGPEVGRETQVYVPLCSQAVIFGAQSQLDRRSSWWLLVMGRRDPSLSLDELRLRVKALAPAAYAATVPPNWAANEQVEYQKRTLNVFPAPDGISTVRDRYHGALRIMMGAVALLLLIACANVANLLLARAAARQREVAVRLAIGAAKRRLMRQMLTESALLALLGAIGGLVIAHWGTRGLVALISTPESPVTLDLGLSLRVLGFTILVAAAAAVFFGLFPVWRGTRVGPQSALKASARGVAEGHARFTLGKSLVVVQVALSLTLLAGAGLLVGSLRNLRTMDPGFTAEGLLIVVADFRLTGLSREEYRSAQTRALERIRGVPGVRSASTSDLTPVGRSSWNDVVYVEGYTASTAADSVAWFNEVSDGYFATLDTRLVAGRDFDRSDVPQGSKTAIVNEAAAQHFFGTASPLGRTFRTKAGDTFSDPYTVVGVVENAKYQQLRETSSATIYLAASQYPAGSPQVSFEVRAHGDPMVVAPAVKKVLTDDHRGVTLDVTTLDRQLARSLRREHVLAVLSSLFGIVALALSMLGLYGVMAYTVARRQNEIGVRIALGAAQGRVLRMVLGDVARVVLIGVGLGIAGAVASGRLVRSFLFGLAPGDPAVLATAAAVLALVALGAGLVPALRASRVDPVAALRED